MPIVFAKQQWCLHLLQLLKPMYLGKRSFTMKRVLSMALIVTLLAAFSFVIPAGAQDDAIECFGAEGSELSVMGPWAGDEENKFKAAIDPVLAACEITLSYEGTRDMNTVLPTRVEGDQAPDLAVLSNPGQI